MNRLKPLAARIPLITALIFVSVNSGFPPPVLAQENPGKISFQPSVIPEVHMSYENYTFRVQYREFFIRVVPFVIYGGEYYDLKQIVHWLQNNYPQVSYSWLLKKLRTSIHYGFNITQLPQAVADNLDYVGFRLVDLNFPLSWMELEVKEVRVRGLGGEKRNRTRILIPRANLKFGFEDLFPWGYSVEVINRTYILIGAVKGERSLHIDPIVYSSGDLYVTGTYTDLFEDLYQADQSGGWGVVGKTGQNAYSLNDTELHIGNSSSAYTSVSDESCVVNMFGGPQGYAMYVYNNATATFGALLSSTTKATGNGVAFKLDDWYYMQFDEGSTLNFYGCSIVSNENLELDLYGGGNLYRTTFSSGYYMLTFHNTANYDVYDVSVSNDFYENWSWYDSGGANITINQIYSYNSANLFFIEAISSGITIENLYGREALGETFDVCTKFDINLINPDVDVWSFDHEGDGEIYRQYTYDLKVTWDNSSAIQNCEIWLSHYGQGGGQDFHGYTNSTGQIPSQPITIEHYNETGGNTPYSYGPFRLRLKYGEVEYIQNFTHPGEAMDLIIALQPPQEAPSQGPFFHAYTVDYGSFSLGIQAPKEIHPSFQEYMFNSVPIHIGLRLDNYQIRARDFQLSYQLKDLTTGELRINGSSLLNVEAGGYETVGLEFVEPFGKRATPRNYTLSLTVEVGDHEYSPILYNLSLSHSKWGPLIYSVGFFSIFGALICFGYGLYHYWPRIRKEAKTYYG